MPGSAESKGKITFHVKWVGTGMPPTYMYFALDSSASAAETFDGLAPLISGSNGQGDPLQLSEVSGLSQGVHAKRLKLDLNREATYTVSLHAKSEKNAIAGSLVANLGVLSILEPKALGLFEETNRMEIEQLPYGNGIDYAVVRASTGDVEKENAEIGCQANLIPVGLFEATRDSSIAANWEGSMDTVLEVCKVGNWLGGVITTSISPGSKENNYGSMGGVISMRAFQDLTGAEIASMRETPKVYTGNANGSDPESYFHGPFHGNIKVSVWAPERIIDRDPVSSLSWYYHKLMGGYMFTDVDPGLHILVRLAESTIGEDSTEVSGSSSFEINLWAFGVKLDCGNKVGHKHMETVSGGIDDDIDNRQGDSTIRVRFIVHVEHHNLERAMGKYGPNGYEGSFFNTIQNATPATLDGKYVHEYLNGQ